MPSTLSLRRRRARRIAHACFACAVLAPALHAQRAAPRVLRVAVAPGLDAESAAGVTFGLAEAARAAALVGDSVALETLRDDDAPVDVVIAGDDATSCRELGRLARTRGVLVVDAWCDVPDVWAPGPLRGGRFAVLHVGPAAALREAIAEREGVIPGRVVTWHPALERYGAAQLAQRWRAARGTPLGERAWRGWAAVKLVTDVALRLDGAPRAPALVAAFARAPALDGNKGRALHFNACDGVLRQPLYVVGDTAGAPREVEWPATAVIRCGWRR